MGWDKNHLYVGSNRNYACTIAALHATRPPVSPYPPAVRLDAQGPGSPPRYRPYRLPLVAAAALDPTAATPLTQTNCTKVYESPAVVPMTIANTAVLGPRIWPSGVWPSTRTP